MALQLRKAERSQAKTRLGLSGPAGAGKTTSALMIAYGICPDWNKIALIDTENRSADLYANFKVPDTGFTIGQFQKIDLDAPYAPERYIEAIKACENAGMEVIIIDSISHEWEGKGGCLDSHEKLGGQFKHWAEVTPRHKAFIDAILESKCHVITCARAKVDYAVITDGGKTKVEKVGLKDITREGFDYELTADLDLDLLHNARASKDRTGLFMSRPPFVPSVEVGKALRKWCDAGGAKPQEPEQPPAEKPHAAQQPEAPQEPEYSDSYKAAAKDIENAKTTDELDDIVAKYKGQLSDTERKAIGKVWNAKKAALSEGF